MEDLFKWSLITAFVISLVTFLLNFVTKGIGIKIIVAVVLTVLVIIYFMKKYGVPDSGFSAGSIIGLAAMAGLAVVVTTDVLEYILTLLLFVIAFFIGGFVGKWSSGGSAAPRKRRKEKEEKEEEEEEPEEIEENEVSGE
ncbi:MAG: hypothetical protein QXM31_03165 [Candidatus Woesearchaeota archaeon]